MFFLLEKLMQRLAALIIPAAIRMKITNQNIRRFIRVLHIKLAKYLMLLQPIFQYRVYLYTFFFT